MLILKKNVSKGIPNNEQISTLNREGLFLERMKGNVH